MILLEYIKMAEKSNEKRKKILYIITKSVWGGAGKYVYDLATNLSKDRFEVFVAAGGQNELAQKLISAGIPYFEIKNFQKNINVLKEIFSYFEILALLFKIRPDIIHVNSSKAGGIVGIAAFDYRFFTLNFKVKTIFTAHGWAFHENRPKWQIFLIKFFSQLTAFFYSKIICVSEYDRQSAIKNGVASEKKIIAIHNGINYDKYKFLPKKAAREKLFKIGQFHHMVKLTNKILVGTIGEFTENKGQKYLIDTIKSLVTRYPLLVTIIIGWGKLKKNLEEKIKRENLENYVFIIDNLTNAAPPFLKAFDIFVLPSIKEGLPYTLLEAGLAGVPVISTQTGGIPEIIEDKKTGLLAKPADSQDLAEKIEELINDEQKGKLFSSALWQKIVQEFSLSKMLSATLTAYE